jgi:HEAT repeat protein
MTPAEAMWAALRDRDARRGLAVLYDLLTAELTLAGELPAALADADALVRRRAAQALGYAPAAVAVAALAESLARDPSWPVREAAAQALAANVNDPAARAALVRAALCDRQTLVRSAAAVGLTLLNTAGGTAVVAEFREALGRPQYLRRRRAVAALARLREPAAVLVKMLGQALADPHAKVRLDAAQVLGTFGPVARLALGGLVRRRFDRDGRVAAAAGAALAKVAPVWQAVTEGRDAAGALTAALARELPEAVRAEFAAACRRRRRWHARHAGRPEPPDAPPGGELAALLDEASERDAEAVWLLGLLAELEFAEPRA